MSNFAGFKPINVVQFEYECVPLGILPVRITFHDALDIDPRKDGTERFRIEFG